MYIPAYIYSPLSVKGAQQIKALLCFMHVYMYNAYVYLQYAGMYVMHVSHVQGAPNIRSSFRKKSTPVPTKGNHVSTPRCRM